MTAVRLLPASGYREMPWKNGGGITAEIAAYPVGAPLDQFEWRVSMAHVTSDGAFSNFPQTDRTLTLVEGNGVVLTIAGQDREVTPDSPPVSFPADVPTAARLPNGAITDLNVMTQRGLWRHHVRSALLAGSMTLTTSASTTIILLRQGALAVSGHELRAVLNPRDSLMAGAGCSIEIQAAGAEPAAFFLIELRPA
jgi:uncharacterized protein